MVAIFIHSIVSKDYTIIPKFKIIVQAPEVILVHQTLSHLFILNDLFKPSRVSNG